MLNRSSYIGAFVSLVGCNLIAYSLLILLTDADFAQDEDLTAAAAVAEEECVLVVVGAFWLARMAMTMNSPNKAKTANTTNVFQPDGSI